MSSVVKAGLRQWITGGVILLFFCVLSYGFIVFSNNKSFTASIKNIREIAKELKLHNNLIHNDNIDSRKKIKSFFNKVTKEHKWITAINLLYTKNGKLNSFLTDQNTDNIFLPKHDSYCDIHYNIKDFTYKLVLPVEIDKENSWYLFIQGNIIYFFYLNNITKIYVGLSIISFLLMGWFFYRQYIRLQKVILTGNLSEQILAEKSRMDEIVARFARSVILSNSINEASIYAREAISQLFGCQYCFAGYIDEADGSLHLSIGNSKYEAILGESSIEKNITEFYGIWGKSISEKRSFYINFAKDENGRLPGRNGFYNAKSILAVPAVVKDRVVGIIAAADKNGPFNQYDQKNLEKIAGLFAVSIQKEAAFSKVKESEERFKATFKTNPDCVIITTYPEGKIVDINEGCCTASGYSKEDAIGRLTTDLNIWEDIKDRENVLSEVAFNDKVINYEAKFRHKSGKFITGLISASKIELNGKPHMLSIIREIENLKKVENELRRERTFLSNVVETSPAGIIAADGKTGKIIYANRRIAEILKMHIKDIEARYINDKRWDIRDFNFQEMPESELIYSKMILSRSNIYDVRHTVLDGLGNRIYLSINAAPIINSKTKEIDLVVVALEDISEKIITERHLRETEERLNSVIGSLPVILWAVDKNGIITLCRGMGLKPLGVKPDAFIGKSAFERYKDHKEIISVLNEGYQYKEFTKIVKFKDRYYQVTISPTRNREDEITGLSGVGIDISRRVKMEGDQAILSSAVEQAAESIIITDQEGKIIYVNPAFENISEFSKDEVIGKNPNIIKSGFHDKFFYTDMWNTLIKGKTWHGYIKNRSKSGNFFEEEASISPIFDRSGAIKNFVAVKRDVTQERKMETQLRKAQKLEAIGTLAGGIAHDFNNILFPIIGFTELMMTKSEDKESQRYLENILSAAYRAKELVHQILTFSRQNEEEKKPVKVHVIVREVLKLLRASIPSTIEIQHHIEDSESTVIADPIKIHQLVMNLGTNAYQSMDNGGILGIYVETVDINEYDGESDLLSEICAGRYVKVTVTDTGYGIPKNIRERIFDPYFTTKPQGKGTGLGLSTVHGIVKSCNGHVKLYSEEGIGSAFHVFLPVASDHNQTIKPFPELNIKGGNEHVLIVDDEELIVDVIDNILSDLGYKTSVRTSSLEALEAFKANPDKFDLIVSDHTMPNMTGIDMAMKVHKIRPHIPIILCSGFSEIVTRQKAEIAGISSFIMKPILKKDLAFAVRKALDSQKQDA